MTDRRCCQAARRVPCVTLRMSKAIAVSEYNGADTPSSTSVVYELDSNGVWDHAGLDASGKK